MSLLSPLPVNAPKKWIKQEIHRLKKLIEEQQNIIKHHAELRQTAGLNASESQKELKESKDTKPSNTSKARPKDNWGVKLSYSLEIPKKRGRPRKNDPDLNQTRIVFFRSQPNT